MHATLAPTTHAPRLLLSISTEWEGAGAPSIADLASLLKTLTYMADNAERANTPASSLRLSFETDLTGPTGKRIGLRHIEFASPLSIAVVLPEVIMAGSAGLAVFLYMFKRVFAFDLEVRAHREHMRNDLLTARAESARLEYEIERFAPGIPGDVPRPFDEASVQRRRFLSQVDGATRGYELPNWTVTEGELTEDDEDESPEHA